MFIWLISHCFCWLLIPKHQAKQWNYLYDETRSVGLSPAISSCVKLIHKNVSSIGLEHSTSQGECYFRKSRAEEIYPITEGARTTYMRKKISPEPCKWCTDLVLALSWGWISPTVPIPTQRYKARSYQSACPRASLQPSNCYSLLCFSRMQLLRLHYGSRTKWGEKSQQELPHAVNPQKTPLSVMLCLFLS